MSRLFLITSRALALICWGLAVQLGHLSLQTVHHSRSVSAYWLSCLHRHLWPNRTKPDPDLSTSWSQVIGTSSSHHQVTSATTNQMSHQEPSSLQCRSCLTIIPVVWLHRASLTSSLKPPNFISALPFKQFQPCIMSVNSDFSCHFVDNSNPRHRTVLFFVCLQTSSLLVLLQQAEV